METKSIEVRYQALATDSCCLSCGGAVDHGKAQVGEVCVDLGSGRGLDVVRMAGEVGETGFVYGIDITEAMLKKARRSAEKLGLENVDFLHADLESLPLPSESVDLIISNCVLNHASNKQKVWDEIHRILKPGGRFVVSDIYSSQEVPEEYKTDPDAVAECWAGSDTKEVYFETVKRAGFKEINILEESDPYPKGKITVSSMTLSAYKGARKCC